MLYFLSLSLFCVCVNTYIYIIISTYINVCVCVCFVLCIVVVRFKLYSHSFISSSSSSSSSIMSTNNDDAQQTKSVNITEATQDNLGLREDPACIDPHQKQCALNKAYNDPPRFDSLPATSISFPRCSCSSSTSNPKCRVGDAFSNAISMDSLPPLKNIDNNSSKICSECAQEVFIHGLCNCENPQMFCPVQDRFLPFTAQCGCSSDKDID